MVKDLNEQAAPSLRQEQLNEDVIKELAFQATGNLAPVNAFVGGLAAQEVMKVMPGSRNSPQILGKLARSSGPGFSSEIICGFAFPIIINFFFNQELCI